MCQGTREGVSLHMPRHETSVGVHVSKHRRGVGMHVLKHEMGVGLLVQRPRDGCRHFGMMSVGLPVLESPGSVGGD